MTISTTVTSVQYLRNGTTTQWGWPNKIFAAADLTVNDLDTSVPPIATLLILGTDYTVSNVDVDTGCLIVTTLPGIAGHTLDVRSNIVQNQLTSIKNQGSYLPELHEEFFDRITRELQDLRRLTYLFGIHGPDNEVVPWGALPPSATRANTTLVFDGTGKPGVGITPTVTFTQAIWDAYLASTVNLYPRTAAEIAASVLPTSYLYAPFDLRRYGGDPTGVSNTATPLASLLSVLVAAGGGVGVIPPGTYNLATSVAKTILPASGPTTSAHGVVLSAYGAVINFTGTGVALDFTAVGTSAYFAQPWLAIYGLNIELTGAASGGFRSNDVSAVRYYDCFVFNGTAASGFIFRNLVNWSENCHMKSCGVVTCLNGVSFVNALTPPAGLSFARFTCEDFFGAGITNYWFDVGAGCAVYDSRFTHLCGNFGSIAYFGIGAAGAGATMQSTVIDGIDAEWNGNPNGFLQGIIRLRDYPQASGALRPILYNVSINAQFTGATPVPIWTRETGATLPGPESTELQPFVLQTGLTVQYGVSQIYENLSTVAALRTVSTQTAVLPTVTMTGFAAVSGRMTMSRTGTMVTLSALDSLTGTSNATSMGMTGIPAEYQPTAVRIVACMVQNNGVQVQAQASISPAGVITFSMQSALNVFSTTGFTNAASNGLPAGTTLSYQL